MLAETPLNSEQIQRARKIDQQKLQPAQERRHQEAIPQRLKTPEKPKDVAVMTVAELLLIAQHIEIEQSSLKRLYEADRVDQEGLRRIVRAYLRGDHYERLLHENLKTPEQFNYAETQHRRADAPAGQSSLVAATTGAGGYVHPKPDQTNSSASMPSSVAAKKTPAQPAKKSRTTLISVVIVLAIAAILYLTIW